jgi:hypothetical protein
MAAAPWAGRSSFGTSAACVLPEEPYDDDDGIVDRSTRVILIGSIYF